MSLKDVSTKFDLIDKIDVGLKRYEVYKAVNDDIYQIVTRNISYPMRNAFTLVKIEFLSEKKYKEYNFGSQEDPNHN